jgi:imidazolonepropionase-like amidohydrolase
VSTRSGLSAPGETAFDPTAYRGLALIDGVHEGAQDQMCIVVRDGRIERVLPDRDATTALGSDVRVIDATGLHAVPGLIDAHVHMATLPDRPWAEAQLRRMLYGGITAVRDMAGDMRALADLARAALIHEIEAPDLYYAALMCGPDFYKDPRAQMATLGVTAGAVPWAQAVGEDTDMGLAVAMARGTWATGIKLYACLCGSTVRRAIAEGRRQGMPVWAHLKVYPATPMDAVGATTVSHACMLAEHVLDPSIPDYFTPRRKQLRLADLSMSDPQTQDYIRALAASGTILDATLLVEQWLDNTQASAVSGAEGRLESRSAHPTRVQTAGQITRALHEAGVPIAAGTDLPSDPEDPYPSLQSEMELLVRHAGMTPAQALCSATRVNAAALGKLDQMGTLEPGKQANFVLVDGNPLEDISVLRRIRATVKRGRRFVRAEYRHDPVPLRDAHD